MSNGARVRILGDSWNGVDTRGKWQSPLLVSKVGKGEGEGEVVSGRRTEGKEKWSKDLSPLKIQFPFF